MPPRREDCPAAAGARRARRGPAPAPSPAGAIACALALTAAGAAGAAAADPGAAASRPAAAYASYPGGAGAGETGVRPGVRAPRRAWQDWALNCQGCHRPDGDGSPQTAPKLAGHVARFLRVPGGREYLARIPGIASSPLPDARLSEVVNWMLWRFDARDLPAHFKPYTAAEIGRLRTRPLRLEAAAVRRALIARER
jgi:Cytochrome c